MRLQPKQWAYVNTLGAGYYRAGEYQNAVQTLLDDGKLDTGNRRVFDLLFLAMSHQQLGQPDRARECRERWLQEWRQHSPGFSAEEREDFELLSTEAETRLGIKNAR